MYLLSLGRCTVTERSADDPGLDAAFETAVQFGSEFEDVLEVTLALLRDEERRQRCVSDMEGTCMPCGADGFPFHCTTSVLPAPLFHTISLAHRFDVLAFVSSGCECVSVALCISDLVVWLPAGEGGSREVARGGCRRGSLGPGRGRGGVHHGIETASEARACLESSP